MKTASLITIHIGSNFGSNLQTIATCEVLKSLGIETTVVNYIPPRVSSRHPYKAMYQTSFPKMVWRTLLIPFGWQKQRIYRKQFVDYLASYCKVSEPIYAEDNFASMCPKTDYYITGSDQVWNVTHNQGIDTHYFWEGISGKKISYASSIGNATLSEEEKLLYPRFLAEFKAISVREDSAKQSLHELGFDSEQLVDPTFMLDRFVWEKYASPRLVKEPYLCVYLPYNIANKDIIYSTVRKIANIKRLKVVTFAFTNKKDKYADQTFCNVNPSDFLSLMRNADFVVTNSFHGIAFSINLNKQFYAYMPSGFKSRLVSILELCGLEDRALSEEIAEDAISNAIDYGPVNRILEGERAKAIEFLKKALS